MKAARLAAYTASDADPFEVGAMLARLAAESRWVHSSASKTAALAPILAESPVAVLAVLLDPTEPYAGFLAAAWAQERYPDVPVVVLATAKLPDDKRARLMATAFDLGAVACLFPPHAPPVVAELFAQVMHATQERVARPGTRRAGDDAPIDLATGDYEEAAP